MKQAEFKVFFEAYRKRFREFETTLEEAKNALKEAIAKAGIKVHSVFGRVKDFDSCVKKVTSKNIKDPFGEINDFVGLRVVCLFLSDLGKVEKVIRDTFEVIERDDKINNNEKDVFGYLGIHFIVRFKNNANVNDTLFEIQIRTISQDAWASVSHHLNYKNSSIPNKLRRDFHALSGLFYVADTHFSFIKQEEM